MTVDEYAKTKRAKDARRRYDKRLAEHRCVTCGGQDERTLEGHTRCAACYAKAYRNPQVRSADQKKRDAEKKRDRSAARAAAMQCVDCGHQDYRTLNGKQFCARCQRRRNATNRAYRDSGRISENQKRRRARLVEMGLCSKCGKNAPEEGRRWCTDCIVRERMRRERKKYAL